MDSSSQLYSKPQEPLSFSFFSFCTLQSIMRSGNPQPAEQPGTKYSQRHGKAALGLKGRWGNLGTAELHCMLSAIVQISTNGGAGAQSSACKPHALD